MKFTYFQADDFILGTCDIRWSYMLAVIGCCDALLLGTLALTLGYKQILSSPFLPIPGHAPV